MSPFRRMWLKLMGRHDPDVFDQIHHESVELTMVAKVLRARLESYQTAEDPFVAMIQDVWNKRQLMMNGHAKN